MQKLSFSILLSILFFSFSKTQAQGYLRAGAGAGFNVGQDAFAIPSLERDSSNDIILQRTIFGSFGQGARFSIAGGYMITPYFGVELELYYFQGFKQAYGNSEGPVGDQYSRTGYSYQMRATPSLVVQAPVGKFQPYARFGVLLPFFGKTVLEESWSFANQSSRAKQTDIDGKLSVGFESSIGLEYRINDNLGIYAQATYTGLRIRSDKATVVKDERTEANGDVVNNLDAAKVITTQIEFQDVITKESNTHSALGSFVQDLPEDILIKINAKLDLDKPLNLPTQTSNFNALSFSVGIKYTFGKKD
ncbi:porin family protein [Aureispira anguillae]|uniref:Porin family protein n=1 Tax=Aureispira anguillae TaxID=2864201 RepID=A0A916DUA4_9BACT|nr:porin family protein [Aureispira anguillae]BDS13974.1 porin family protein [Aureispira anguillae]